MNDIAHTPIGTRIVAYGEANRFGMICLALLLVGCMGGITMAFGASQYLGALIAVLIPTMATLSACLAVAPFRFILVSFLAAFVIDTIVSVVLLML